MNPTIETWNAWAVVWAEFMGSRLADTTLAMAIVSGLWLLLRRWASPQLGYCLFLLVLIKFVMPLELTVPVPQAYLSAWPGMDRAAGWVQSAGLLQPVNQADPENRADPMGHPATAAPAPIPTFFPMPGDSESNTPAIPPISLRV